jgi:PAS domain S-box-containing protein
MQDDSNKKKSKTIKNSDQPFYPESKYTLLEKIEGYDILANTVPVMLWLSGPDKNVYFVNKKWVDFRGTSFEEEIGIKWSLGLHENDREKAWKIYSEAFDARRNFEMQYRLKNKDGIYRWISSTGVPRYGEDERFLGYAGSCADIDDQKNFADKLEKEVENRTKEILEKNRELEEKNEELNSFASVASHDLKEPLRKIHMFGKMIKDREFDKLSESSKHNLDRIIVSTNRMESLINDLLSYSEITGRKAILVKTDLNDLLAKVKIDLKETIEESQAVIQIGKLPIISSIPTLFTQVFNNLISNSIKYSKKEEKPVITITSIQVKGENILNLGAVASQEYCRISVEDNGIGFPPEVKEKVFEPFKRFHDKEEYSGTGIGLAICKKIVTSHNGFIEAASEIGKGTTFTIYLPCIHN